MKLGQRRWQDWLRLGLPLGFFALVWVGIQIGLPAVVYIGYFILAGGGIALLGGDHFLTHYSTFRHDESQPALTFRIAGELLWGAFWVMVGGLLVVGALALWMGLVEPVTGFLVQRPGPALLVAGLFLLIYALSRLLGTADVDDREGHFFRVLPDRLLGLILLLAGGSALVLGVWELLSPGAFDGFLLENLPVYEFILQEFDIR